MDKIRPATWDRDTGPFFAAAKEGRLTYRRCTGCGRGNHVPVPSCKFCGQPTEWVDAAGKGTLYTWTTIPHQVHPAYPAPYTVVIVTLDEAPDVRLTGMIAGAPELAAGQAMDLWFEDNGLGDVLPNWRPTGHEGETA